jgi:hypothetical protein
MGGQGGRGVAGPARWRGERARREGRVAGRGPVARARGFPFLVTAARRRVCYALPSFPHQEAAR